MKNAGIDLTIFEKIGKFFHIKATIGLIYMA